YDDTALPNQIRRKVLTVIKVILVLTQRRTLIVDLHQLFLAPDIEATMTVQHHYSGRRKFRLFWYEHVCRNAKVGRGLRREVLLDVIASVRATDQISGRRNRWGRVKQVFEYDGPRLLLPTLKIP